MKRARIIDVLATNQIKSLNGMVHPEDELRHLNWDTLSHIGLLLLVREKPIPKVVLAAYAVEILTERAIKKGLSIL